LGFASTGSLPAGLVASHTATKLVLRGVAISSKVSVLKRLNTEEPKISLGLRTVPALTSRAALGIRGPDSKKEQAAARNKCASMNPPSHPRLIGRMSAPAIVPGHDTLIEILSQPAVWEETRRELEGRGTLARLADIFSPRDPWLFIACGSSYYLCQLLASLWSKLLRVPCSAMPASELLFDSREILRRSGANQAILLSRSGETSEVLRAAELLRANGSVLSLGATCNPASSLEKLCDHTLKLAWADEKSTVMTRSFTSFLLAFQRLGAMFAGESASLAVLDRLPAHVAPWLRANEKRIRRFGRNRRFANFVFLGQGLHYWLAQEAALKITEMSTSYAQAYHTLEFRHGPRSIAGRETLIAVLASEAAAQEEGRLIEEMKRLGATTLVVANRMGPRLKRSSDLHLELGLAEPESARLAAMAIPAQLLGCAVGLSKGLNPDAPANLTRFVKLESDGAGGPG
jgi:glucosamine--fructose-6-phosphate aminotransferase (isomerizing)